MDDATFESFDPSFADLLDINHPPELLADGMTWTEGPVWMGDRLYFNDIPAKRMMMWREGQGVTTALPNSEFANGNTRDMQSDGVVRTWRAAGHPSARPRGCSSNRGDRRELSGQAAEFSK